MNSNVCLIESHYFPCLEFFCATSQSGKIILDRHSNYVKQSYRNRCLINSVQGILPLVVPLTAKHGKVAMGDVRVDYSTRWQAMHWRSVLSAYANAPYFEHFAGGFERLIRHNFVFMSDLNREVLSFCLINLGIRVELGETEKYVDEASTGVIDLRSTILAKKPFSERNFYRPKSYYQVFGNRFASNLSIIDLLFCEGPNASHIIKESVKET